MSERRARYLTDRDPGDETPHAPARRRACCASWAYDPHGPHCPCGPGYWDVSGIALEPLPAAELESLRAENARLRASWLDEYRRDIREFRERAERAEAEVERLRDKYRAAALGWDMWRGGNDLPTLLEPVEDLLSVLHGVLGTPTAPEGAGRAE
jgi:hypothetical protein